MPNKRVYWPVFVQAARINHHQLLAKARLTHGNSHQTSILDLLPYRTFKHQRCAKSDLNRLLDGFGATQLHRYRRKWPMLTEVGRQKPASAGAGFAADQSHVRQRIAVDIGSTG